MTAALPDRRVSVGRLNIDLWRGVLRDEVRVWVDLRPALGGLVARKSVWSWGGRGDRLFDAFVRAATSDDGSEWPDG